MNRWHSLFVALLMACGCAAPHVEPDDLPDELMEIEAPADMPYQSFMQDVQRLAEFCPLAAPVRIRIVDMEARGLWGESEWMPLEGLWEIRLTPSSEESMRDTLEHEWAHALCDQADGPTGSVHGPVWGVEFARCYRAVVEHKP